MGVLYAKVAGAWVPINGSTQPFGQQSGTFNLPDQGSAVAGTWYDWGTPQTIPGVGTTPTSIAISVIGTGYATDFTASGAVLHQMRVGISWDNGATWSYGLQGYSATQGASTLNRASFAAQHVGSNPVTTAILVKLQYQANTTTAAGRNGQIYWNLQSGVQGPQGIQGPQGNPGLAGGIITGGLTHQHLIKNSNTSQDVTWGNSYEMVQTSPSDLNTATVTGLYRILGSETNGPLTGGTIVPGWLRVTNENFDGTLGTGAIDTGGGKLLQEYWSAYDTDGSGGARLYWREWLGGGFQSWTAWQLVGPQFFGKNSVTWGPGPTGGMDTANSMFTATLTNGWVQCISQCIWGTAFTGVMNIAMFTLPTQLRPGQVNHSMGITYPTYSAVRVTVNTNGVVQAISSASVTNQTQVWINMGWPLTQR